MKMSKSLQQWLEEGVELYNATVAEYHDLESQLSNLQERLTTKRAEVNQLAQMIGKPTLGKTTLAKGEGREGGTIPTTNGTVSTNGTSDSAVEVTVEVVEPGRSTPYTLSSIARALTGKPTRR